MDHPIFFKDFAELGRAVLVALIGYTGFIIFLRTSGKRTLSKMNVFDFVFVVALGSTLADTILTPDITITKGLVACSTLIIFQVLLSWLTTRSARLEKIINGEPTLLLHKGKCIRDAMRRERVTEEEVRAAVRTHGVASLEKIETVILETDGTFSVVWQETEKPSGLTDVGEQAEHATAERKKEKSSE
jgi:uncharacterized membrane protein YcaP (DUF421 family)